MPWQIAITPSALLDLRWFGRPEGRRVLREATKRLTADPVAETRYLKTLRPNPFAPRELRLAGRYRILFDVDAERRLVTVLVIGEKRGEALVVQGKEFTAHHESDPAQ